MQGITVMRQQKYKPNKKKYMLKSVMCSWRQYMKVRGDEKDNGGRKDGVTEFTLSWGRVWTWRMKLGYVY
jgi:hypothetical protein